ncbi:MAG: hypothetical protein LC731_08915, partial [Acidobacteria bacterium]|nr:hypothetical protein [Acidobacteriota bacterium]
PIRNCPGRYVLRGANGHLSLSDVSSEACGFSEHRGTAAPDTVLVMKLKDGAGLISYRRADGSLLHTLNTPEGFKRKLLQLGIVFLDE